MAAAMSYELSSDIAMCTFVLNASSQGLMQRGCERCYRCALSSKVRMATSTTSLELTGGISPLAAIPSASSAPAAILIRLHAGCDFIAPWTFRPAAPKTRDEALS
eukprot:18679-Heterococcus_DN1.PRE.2